MLNMPALRTKLAHAFWKVVHVHRRVASGAAAQYGLVSLRKLVEPFLFEGVRGVLPKEAVNA